MTLTFVDSGVLIAAARGEGEVCLRALEILDDPARSFASSTFIELEVLPKAAFHKRSDESAFYKAFFAGVDRWAVPDTTLVQSALSFAAQAGLSALDALHVAAAVSVGAAEIITLEKTHKPIHRVNGIAVRTIHPG
ncbi:MAG TPA: PIN domain-containing protein [Thermoanaerobaculia bacterium]|nr:PIN domain-containing protein [Thermoanaerobaculia bacterium]